MAELTVLDTKGNVSTFASEFRDRDEKKVAEFVAPASADTFKAWVASLPSGDYTKQEEGKPYVVATLQDAYYEIMYAIETHAKQSMREQVAQESTIIKRDGREIDLMKIPVAKAVLVVNAGFAMAAATESAPQNALAATRKKLLAENKVKEVNGALVAV